MKNKVLQFCVCFMLGFSTLLLILISPQPASAQGYPDLILTDFYTCWEVYDDPIKGWMWKAYVDLSVKNQGSANSGFFETVIEFPATAGENVFVNFAPIVAGDTRRVREWTFFRDLKKMGQWTGAFCKTIGGSQGFWNTFNPSIAYCGCCMSTGIVLDIGDEVDEGPNEFNNFTIINMTFNLGSDTCVPGHFDWLCSSQPRGTVTPTPPPVVTVTPTPTPRPTSIPDKVYLSFEAESGSVRWPMESAYNQRSSNCRYLYSPEGSGHGKGDVTFKVDIPKTAYYLVFGRVNGTGWSSDSFYLSWDNGSEISWHIPHGWQWDKANHWGTPKNWKLTQGKHTLKIRTREDGSQIDALVVTNDSHYQPSYFQACR